MTAFQFRDLHDFLRAKTNAVESRRNFDIYTIF